MLCFWTFVTATSLKAAMSLPPPISLYPNCGAALANCRSIAEFAFIAESGSARITQPVCCNNTGFARRISQEGTGRFSVAATPACCFEQRG